MIYILSVIKIKIQICFSLSPILFVGCKSIKQVNIQPPVFIILSFLVLAGAGPFVIRQLFFLPFLHQSFLNHCLIPMAIQYLSRLMTHVGINIFLSKTKCRYTSHHTKTSLYKTPQLQLTQKSFTVIYRNLKYIKLLKY